MKILNSPNANVAATQVTELQQTTTRIKQLIIQGASNDEILKVIDEYCNKYKDKSTRLAFKKALIQSTNKMLYQYNHNISTLNNSFISKSIKELGLSKGKTYNVNALQMYEEYTKGNVTQKELITEFRNTLNNGKKGLALIRDYEKQVKEQVKLLASEPMKYTDKNGRTMSLRNKAEMAVRYAANMNDLAEFRQDTKLVWTSSHADASPRCSEFQGKLWSLDGSTGKTKEGIPYRPIEEALNANGGNSIINGYNCRHYLIEYEEGSKAPQHYTHEQIQKEYAIDQKQRRYENQIRQEKTEAMLLREQGFSNDAKAIEKHYQKLEKEYEQYSKDNGRAFSRWRTQVSESERSYWKQQ